jgi:hypothetical protein
MLHTPYQENMGCRVPCQPPAVKTHDAIFSIGLSSASAGDFDPA